ncbi:MAG: carboxypeptidase regulatory-like domain-containing protein [Fimbriimonadaceae bacterium]|nr:carboxypeptidase regulatory-like domain-containing protein [Fimbriimonadaceae bacterium]
MSTFRNGGALALAVLVALAAALLAYGVTTEVPIGSVKGQVTMTENGLPLPHAAVIIRPKTNDDLQTARVRYFRTDENGRFSLVGIPAGLYEVEVSATAHTLQKTARSLLVEEGKTKSVNLPIDPIPQYLELYASQHVFSPNEIANVQIHGFVRSDTLDMRLYQVSTEQVIREKGLYNVLSPMAQKKGKVNAPILRESSWKVKPDDAEGTFKVSMPFESLDPGIYYVQFSAPPFEKKGEPEVRGTYLLISDLALVAKRAKDKVHVFATNIETGEPVAGVPIRLAHGDAVRDLGVTSADGTLEGALAPSEANSAMPSALIGQHGDSSAIVTFYDYGRNSDGMRFFIQTDRPVYRPGDVVHFRAAARRPDGAGYAMPQATTARFQVEDSNGKTIKDQQVPVTSFGTFSGDFVLPAASTEGVTLNVQLDGKAESRSIRIEAYRKPEFKITAAPIKEFYLRGEKAQMRVKCEYYFGGPVVGAELTASVGRAPLWSWVDPETGEEESYGDGWSDYVAEAKAVTDNNGEAILTVDTHQITWGQWDTVDQELVFDISGTEGDDRWFDGTGRVMLLQGDVSIEPTQDRWVVGPGEAATFTFQLSTPDKGSEAIKNREIVVETGYEIWQGQKSVFTPEGKTIVKSNEKGIATLTVRPPNPGDFRVRASTHDRRGSVVQASGWVSVFREGFSFGGPAPELQLMLDQKSYKPGDTIKALVRGQDSGSVWVTLETDRIVAQQVVPLKGGVAQVEFPVSEELKPNAYISASLVRKKQLSTAQRRVTVKLTDEILNITVRSDKPVYKPGETAQYTVTAKDSRGLPVQAEVALGIVDEAVYAIAEDEDNPVDSFYPTRYSMISTYNSFPELYLDGGDKGDGGREVRENFQDTALWTPTVLTNADGTAKVQVQLPDNLTSWRATATGITVATQVGKATQNIVVKKDLMVRLATPMFLTQFDKVALTATVNNSTNQPIEVQTELKADGATIQDEAKKSVRVEPGQAAQVSWQVELPEAGGAEFTVSATSGTLQDAMRAEVPVKVHGKLEVTGETMEVLGERSEFTVQVDPQAKDGVLKLAVAPNLIAAIVPTIEALVDYPYGCIEQTMSRFVPAAVARQTMKRMGIVNPELSAKIDKVTARSLVRVKELQSSQGGWGWFEHDAPTAWTTANALDGLWRAKRAGVPVDQSLVDRGLQWSRQQLAGTADLGTLDDRTMLAAAVLRWGPDLTATKALQAAPLVWKDGKLGTTALCSMIVALGEGEKRSLALRELARRANESRDMIIWDDSWGARSTAMALEALMHVDAQDPRVPKVARGLIVMSKGDRWQSTMDTALAVQALIPYIESRGIGTGTIRVLLNGTEVPMHGQSYREASLPISAMRAGANNVTVRRTGDGSGFMNWSLSQTPMRQTMSAVQGDRLQIKRTFHTLSAQRMEDGTMSLRPSSSGVTSVQSGEAFRCIVTIDTKKPLHYVLVEIPLPSNAKVSERDFNEDWSFWYSGMNLLDDKIAYFANTIPVGRSVIEFNLRAEAVGTSSVLPAQIIEMYSPDRQASTANLRLEVRR